MLNARFVLRPASSQREPCPSDCDIASASGHCAAKRFLEGSATLDAQRAVGAQQLTDRPASASSEPAAKRQRLALECVAKLKELRGLVDSGVLTQAEFCELKTRILEGR